MDGTSSCSAFLCSAWTDGVCLVDVSEQGSDTASPHKNVKYRWLLAGGRWCQSYEETETICFLN